eukprot:9030606-Alexandrium_andersonii.AAC.1
MAADRIDLALGTIQQPEPARRHELPVDGASLAPPSIAESSSTLREVLGGSASLGPTCPSTLYEALGGSTSSGPTCPSATQGHTPVAVDSVGGLQLPQLPSSCKPELRAAVA